MKGDMQVDLWCFFKKRKRILKIMFSFFFLPFHFFPPSGLEMGFYNFYK